MATIPAIGQRIAQIQSLVADPALAVSATTTGTASSSSFAAALADALAAGAATGTSGTDGSSASGSSLLDGSTVDSSGASFLSALGLSGGTGSGSGQSLLDALGLSGSSGLGSSTLDALGLTATSATAGASSTASSPGVLDAHGVPADLAQYGNGHVPASALTPVGSTGVRMWQPAAQALTGLVAAAKADGVTIGITEGYRSYDEQVTLARTKGLYSQGGLAAAPGTSEHGWGTAADLKLDPSALAWMRTNASRFGFVADTPRESWHWAYQPSAA